MSCKTIIGQRLELAIQQELGRMHNEWFFKWHFIGKNGPVEIDSFRGKPICYGGIEYSGSPVDVYWDTICRYRKIKVLDFFNNVEENLIKYPMHVRYDAITEAERLIKMFASSIQRKAIEKDRILRGNGMEFPEPHDLGNWDGSGPSKIESLASGLIEAYCGFEPKTGENYMPMSLMNNEVLSFEKADGTQKKDRVMGLVSKGKVFTSDTSLRVEPNDKFSRKLPSGVVEEFIVEDPGYHAGFGGIKSHFQAKVRRSDATPAPTSKFVNIQGANSRVNIGSVDNSQNVVVSAGSDEIFKQLREMLNSAGLDQEEASKIMAAIDQMEKAKGSKNFKAKYKNFMELTANHTTVFSHLFPGLAALL